MIENQEFDNWKAAQQRRISLAGFFDRKRNSNFWAFTDFDQASSRAPSVQLLR